MIMQYNGDLLYQKLVKNNINDLWELFLKKYVRSICKTVVR